MAPSQAAWSPSRKCEPVITPIGSACIVLLLGRLFLLLVGSEAVNGEIGAVHTAQIASAALFRSYDVGRVIALGVKCGGECQDFRRTELDAEPACLALLNNHRHGTSCHRFLFRRPASPV